MRHKVTGQHHKAIVLKGAEINKTVTHKATAVLVQERVGLQQGVDHIVVLLGGGIPVQHRKTGFTSSSPAPSFTVSLNYTHVSSSLSM